LKKRGAFEGLPISKLQQEGEAAPFFKGRCPLADGAISERKAQVAACGRRD